MLEASRWLLHAILMTLGGLLLCLFSATIAMVGTAAQWCSRGDHSRGERSQGRGCVARSAHSALTPPSLLPSPALSSPLLPLTCSLLP